MQENPRGHATVQSTRMIKMDDIFPVADPPISENVQNTSFTAKQDSKTQDVVQAAPMPLPLSVKASDDIPSTRDQAQEGCDEKGPQNEVASPLTASELLAKLNLRAPGSVLRPATMKGETTSATLQGGRRAGSSVPVNPAPPPPVADKPPTPPNIIAQLFGSTAAKTGQPVSSQQASRDHAMPNVQGTRGLATCAEQGNSKHLDLGAGVATVENPADARREAAKQVIQILLRDDRFIDALADAMSEISALFRR